MVNKFKTFFIDRPKPIVGLLGPYKKMEPTQNSYLAFVAAIRDPLNLHLDIYWTPDMEEKYKSASSYLYSFISEELDDKIHERQVYLCHLKGIEIVNDKNNFDNMRNAYVKVSSIINKSNGWVLVTVGDIDIYRRILVNVFDIISRKSINADLLGAVSADKEPIAKSYFRPVKTNLYRPSVGNSDYHIVFD
jgi:hypothetical protein